jgi:pimeloyl-ACP methyl ester carboxylesterase
MMAVMRKRLAALGFRTTTFSYGFLRNSPAENARDLYQSISGYDARRVNLIGHSLGGIVILHLVDQFPDLAINKIVLLGSPVRGSYVARQIYSNRLLRPLLGKSVDGGLLDGAPAYNSERPLGIITGSGSMGITSVFYPTGENSDGVVKKCETWIETATDRINVPRSHSAMIFSNRCAQLVANFLNQGRFRV